ncbi:MAG TPA: DUF1990 family protein [Thermoleophilaceae bacterium]|nr:DUF1990 family protein [Thermoleophilaceae bacterium]
MRGRPLGPAERAVGWLIGVPFASWRYMARTVDIRRQDSTCPWPIEGFPNGDCSIGDPAEIQRPSGGYGPAFHRRYRIEIGRALLDANELMSIVINDPNVACPLEIARFEREKTGPIEAGDQLRVRLPGAWNGPVRVTHVSGRSFRLATLRGHMEAGEIEFRARDAEDGKLVFEIESWARSGDRVFDFLYDRLGIARELQLDMWAFFLERVAQISGGSAENGIEVYTGRCVEHPL